MAALPDIEIVSSRFRDPLTRPPLEQVADSLINGALVPGAETREWSRLDLARLQVMLQVRTDKPSLGNKGTCYQRPARLRGRAC
jgi:2-keto-4-pentenoate hydratase